MTEFTDEQIEAIRDAWGEVNQVHGRISSHSSSGGRDMTLIALNDLITEITKPAQVFSEGQVVFLPEMEDDQPTGQFLVVYYPDHDSWDGCRPLNQTEVGPDWVPLSEFEKLRDALISILRGDNGHVPYNSAEMVAMHEEAATQALDALPDRLKGE